MKNISKLLALVAFVWSLTATSVLSEGKVGVVLGKGVWAATGEETNIDNNTTDTAQTGSKSGTKDRKGHGAFTDTVQGIFAEYDNGPFSIGLQLNASVDTPEATNVQQSDASGSTQNTNKVKASFANERMIYAIADAPVLGLYLKVGYSIVDVETKENLATGATYADEETHGIHVGIGSEIDLGGASVRIEVMGSEYDDVSATDGNSASDETAKRVEISDMIGARATISLLKAF